MWTDIVVVKCSRRFGVIISLVELQIQLIVDAVRLNDDGGPRVDDTVNVTMDAWLRIDNAWSVWFPTLTTEAKLGQF